MARFRMFIDDTGNIDPGTSNHPQRRFASITGVIFEWDYLHQMFEPGFMTLKERHCGLLPNGKPPILHLRRMKQADGYFRFMRNPVLRQAWQDDCLSMYRRAEYAVITVCVDKVGFYYEHPNWTGDVYELLVGNAIERYFYFLRHHHGQGDVLVEAVNRDCDERLKILYRRFYEFGTDHVSAANIQGVLTSREIKIKPKHNDVQGLQMADLLASTCFNHCRQVYAAGPAYDQFAMLVAKVIEVHKFYRSADGNPHGYGRIWRP